MFSITLPAHDPRLIGGNEMVFLMIWGEEVESAVGCSRRCDMNIQFRQLQDVLVGEG